MTIQWSRRTSAALLLTALGVAQPVQAQDADRQTTIRVGAVSSMTGPVPLGQSAAAARAYFARINAEGGVNGRRIELVVVDDGFDPARARKAGQSMIDDERIVALIGGASGVDCSVNGARYERAGLMAVLGTGFEAACFQSSHLVPLNPGVFRTLKNALQFASTSLGAGRLCALLPDVPTLRGDLQRAVSDWEKASGVRLAHVGRFEVGSNPVDGVREVLAARCDAVVHAGLETYVAPWVRAVQKIPEAARLSTVFLTPAYTARVAEELGSPTVPVYCMTEFEPWSSRSGTLTDWREQMRQSRVPLSSFSQGGYSAAQLFVRLLRGMDGPVTRPKVAQALRAVEGMNLPMLGTPITVGPGKMHNPNRSSMGMKLEAGSWRIATPQWLEAP
jgi:branched-chain amino acid transport system substrate-binding protein